MPTTPAAPAARPPSRRTRRPKTRVELVAATLRLLQDAEDVLKDIDLRTVKQPALKTSIKALRKSIDDGIKECGTALRLEAPTPAAAPAARVARTPKKS